MVRLHPAEEANPADSDAVERAVGDVIERVQRLVAEEVADGDQQKDAGQTHAAQQAGHTSTGDATTNIPIIVYQGIMMRPSSAGRVIGMLPSVKARW